MAAHEDEEREEVADQRAGRLFGTALEGVKKTVQEIRHRPIRIGEGETSRGMRSDNMDMIKKPASYRPLGGRGATAGVYTMPYQSTNAPGRRVIQSRVGRQVCHESAADPGTYGYAHDEPSWGQAVCRRGRMTRTDRVAPYSFTPSGARMLPGERSVQGGWSQRVRGVDDEEGPWEHDLFEGNSASCPGSEIFIRNLPVTITSQQLTAAFEKVGIVVSVKIDRGPLTTARVAFLKKYSAADAVERFHGRTLKGQRIKVAVVEAPTPRPQEEPDLFDTDDVFYVNQEGDITESAQRYGDAGYIASSRRRGSYNGRRVSAAASRFPILRSEAPQASVFDRLG